MILNKGLMIENGQTENVLLVVNDYQYIWVTKIPDIGITERSIFASDFPRMSYIYIDKLPTEVWKILDTPEVGPLLKKDKLKMMSMTKKENIEAFLSARTLNMWVDLHPLLHDITKKLLKPKFFLHRPIIDYEDLRLYMTPHYYWAYIDDEIVPACIPRINKL